MSDRFELTLTDADWDALELRYWRGRLVEALAARGVVRAFQSMTAHAPTVDFRFDHATRCMRNASRPEGLP